MQNYSEQKKSEAADKEEAILSFWREQKIFEKSLEKNASEGEFIFYEGPPTANGRPGVHHLESRSFKDAIPRYKTMRGYHVRRKGGWDTHGLPVELEVEKQLGLHSKKEIEEYGVVAFNEKCRESVWKYVDEWQQFTHRMGYWVDLDNPYITYHADYVESLWSVVKKVDDRGLLYKDYKVLPWCPRCGTALSSHELAQGYKDVDDISIYAKFKIIDPEQHDLPVGAAFIAWTTTPWTLPGNVGLAVHPDVTYVLNEDNVIFAKELMESISGASRNIVKEFKGKDLLGIAYEPLFPYLRELAEKNNVENLENAYKVYPADFVTTEDGTGIVHTAVMYGQEDFDLGTEVGLPKLHLVKQDGTFVEGTDFLAGRFVKEETDGKPTLDIDILKYLQENDTYFHKQKYNHSYPHCWRCKTPLIYYARDSWYIRMSEIKQDLINENQKINWEPAHIRDGRFGEWLRDLKDWAISRERYWGTPLPVWESEDGDRIVVGSFADIQKHLPPAKNNFYIIRHGESLSNQDAFMNGKPGIENPITDKGRQQVIDRLPDIKKIGVTKMYVSPLQRTQETATIIKEGLGLSDDQVITDERLIEFDVGEYEGKPHQEFINDRDSSFGFGTPVSSGESYRDVTMRVGEFLYEKEAELENETILIVAHGAIAETAHMVINGYNDVQAWDAFDAQFIQNAELRKLDLRPMPHNDRYEFDPHRPFVDEVVLERDGKEFKRTPEVMDVWFDSGAMPFAQDHYPFREAEPNYPADFICEAIDQTRGWFYTLHAVGALMERGLAYKNVISLGHILDAEGQKMSKSKGNTVNPWDMMNKYGADTVRFWMYSVNQPGEPKNFDERTVVEMQRKVFGMLDNVVKFYELYAGDEGNDPTKSTNVLDQWILARLAELIKQNTAYMDEYKLLEPARNIREFIGDLSQWFIRRSRDRFKGEDQEDKAFALGTTNYVLLELAKLMAPFAPFTAEDIYRRVNGREESVHLTDWPTALDVHPTVLETMQQTRDVISAALLERDKAGIRVRQPLAELTISEKLSEQYIELIRDEVNVKSVVVGDALALDTNITPELAAEGNVRELIRHIQAMRKQAKLNPEDTIKVLVSTDVSGEELVNSFADELKKVAGISEIGFGDNNGETLEVSDMKFSITFR